MSCSCSKQTRVDPGELLCHSLDIYPLLLSVLTKIWSLANFLAANTPSTQAEWFFPSVSWAPIKEHNWCLRNKNCCHEATFVTCWRCYHRASSGGTEVISGKHLPLKLSQEFRCHLKPNNTNLSLTLFFLSDIGTQRSFDVVSKSALTVYFFQHPLFQIAIESIQTIVRH